MRASYGLIVGQGRSGTNWLLELFDQSPETFCRNEPYGPKESPLLALMDDRTWVRADQSALEAHWDEVVARLSSHMGNRDHEIPVPKEYLNPLAQRSGVYHVFQSPRARALLGRVLPFFRLEESPVPRFIADPARLAGAATILKLVTPPGWCVFVLEQRPEVPVFHIVRHPGGFLNSWANRWARGRDQDAILRDNRARLRSIVAEDPSWGPRFGDIETASVERTELCYWLYMNEVIHAAGEGRERYVHIVYEDLVEDPVATMRRCFDTMGLAWSREIEARIRRTGGGSAQIADAWRSKLTPERVALVDEFLALEPRFYPLSRGA